MSAAKTNLRLDAKDVTSSVSNKIYLNNRESALVEATKIYNKHKKNNMRPQHYTGKFKVTFAGDAGVGKTSIIVREMYDTFQNQYESTIGIDFLCKTLNLPDSSIRLHLWDTAGQERFRSLTRTYMRDANACVIVYDASQPADKAFKNLKRWVDDIRSENSDVVLFLVGNKIDARQISQDEGKAKAQLYNLLFCETSAKHGEGVKEMFKAIALEFRECIVLSRMNAQQHKKYLEDKERLFSQNGNNATIDIRSSHHTKNLDEVARDITMPCIC